MRQRLIRGPRHIGPWYWITGRAPSGKLVLIGPESTEIAAFEKGMRYFEGVFDVTPLPSKDKRTATSMLKAKLLDQTCNLSESLKPVSHYDENN